jgi:hypothetical protein
MTDKNSGVKTAVRKVALTATAMACMAPSIHINVLYQLGHGGEAALSKSAVSALAVIVAGICPIAMRRAAAAREWVMAAVSAGVFAACLQFNLVSAIGVSSTLRAETVGSVVKDSNAADSLQKMLDGLLADVAPLKVRAGGSTPAMIDKERAAMRNDARWESTDGCNEGKVTRNESRAFCASYEAKAVAMEAASRVVELDRAIADLRPKVDAANANSKTHGQPADPQTATVVSVLQSIGLQVSKDGIVPVLNLELAIILEVISCLGPLVLSYAMGLDKSGGSVRGQAVHDGQVVRGQNGQDGQPVRGQDGQAVHDGQNPGQAFVQGGGQPIDPARYGQDGQENGQDGQERNPVHSVHSVHASVQNGRPKLVSVPKDDFTDKVYRLMKDGQNIRQIAEALGCSKSKVGAVVKRLREDEENATVSRKSI